MEQIKKFEYIIGGKNAVWYSVSKYLPWVSLRLCSGQGTAALWEQLTRPSIPFLHLCPHVPSNSWPRMFAHAISSEKNTLYLQASVLLSFSATQVLCSSPQLKAFLSPWIKPQASPLSSAKPSLFLNLICSSISFETIRFMSAEPWSLLFTSIFPVAITSFRNYHLIHRLSVLPALLLLRLW